MQEDDAFFRTSRLDIAIVAVVIVCSLSYIAWKAYGGLSQDGQKKEVIVYQKETLIEKFPLDKDSKTPLLNGRMQLEIAQGRARIFSSDCPQNICVHLGWIHYSGQSIVCVPNQITVEIKSDGVPLLDGVSY
ncbi:MAG: NusG domain II-containing protein [Elusimicrobia bacterium]|nr:NusG domain II-containing protein [Elusimicrobiota bacterium]